MARVKPQKIGINNDGIQDVVMRRGGVDTRGRLRMRPQPALSLASGKRVLLKEAPDSFTSSDKEFGPYLYSGKNPRLRFYNSDRPVLSFVPGQKAGVVNPLGRVVDVISIDGFAMGLQVKEFHKGKPVYVPFESPTHGDHIRAYARGGDHQIGLRKLVWVAGPSNSRIDPRNLSPRETRKSLTGHERLLRPLFLKTAAAVKTVGFPKTRAQKAKVRDIVERLMRSWTHAKRSKTERRLQQHITKDKSLWEGIRMALYRIGGLTAADRT